MNILILTGRFGMGHIKAAGAITEELLQAYPKARIDTVDFMEYLFPTLSPCIYKGFQLLVSRCSGLYNSLNHIAGRYGDVPMKRALLRKMDDLLSLYQPDLILATLPICGQYISAYKALRRCRIPLYTYITDITVHEEWLSSGTDLYFVGDSTTKNALLVRGIPSDKILVTGIPVSQAFQAAGAEKIAKRKNAGAVKSTKMNADGAAKSAVRVSESGKAGTGSPRPENSRAQDSVRTTQHLLVMGGGLGLIPGGLRLLENLSRDPRLSITLIAGTNTKLADQVRAACPSVRTIGFTDQVARYMQEADLLVTKPGGTTTFEAIASRTPLYVVCPFLEQERGNAHFIENTGIGRVLWDTDGSAGMVERDLSGLLSDANRLSAMQQNMDKLSASFLHTNAIDCYMEANVEAFCRTPRTSVSTAVSVTAGKAAAKAASTAAPSGMPSVISANVSVEVQSCC